MAQVSLVSLFCRDMDSVSNLLDQPLYFAPIVWFSDSLLDLSLLTFRRNANAIKMAVHSVIFSPGSQLLCRFFRLKFSIHIMVGNNFCGICLCLDVTCKLQKRRL